MVKRPMKAPGEPITDRQLKLLDYPVCASPKLDGIRALATGQQVLSATLKPIGNAYIQECLNRLEYKGLDGELVVGLPYNEHEEDDVFNRTTGAVRRKDGTPDFKFYVFDDFNNPTKSYSYRWLEQLQECPEIYCLPHLVILEQRMCFNVDDVLAFEAECIEKGYEGIMVRTLDAPYKEGRSTLKEEYIFKRKPVADDEAEIVGFYEQLENLNEKVTNELGTSTRSSHKENKVPKNTLGGFVLRSTKWDDTFNCGTIIGSTLAMRKDIWDNKEKYLGQVVKYKYQAYGSLEKPRQPRIQGFRDKSDITDF